MMNRPRRPAALLLLALLAGCASGDPDGTPTAPPAPPAATPAQSAGGASQGPAGSPVPLEYTWVEPLEVTDFDAVHRALEGDPDRGVIFGGLAIEPAAGDVPPETATFLGRWEGYGLGPPIRRDWRYVLAVTSITARDGYASLWAGTKWQFPALVAKLRFRVRGSGPETVIEWKQDIGGADAVVSIRHAFGTDALEGGTTSGEVAGRMGPVLLRRDTTEALVDRDPGARLAGLGITWQPHEDPALAAVGAGSLVYLPPGYDADPDRSWPLLLFLHGAGDRGDNGLVIAQNSPFRFITGGGTLDAVIVAPLLGADRSAFPEAYLEGVLEDARSRLRVDRSRVAVVGLSMGGEAGYRLARHRPDDIAALAVLCGFESGSYPEAERWGYAPIEAPVSRLRGMPVLVVHGRDDITVPLAAAEAAVAEMEDAGAEVLLRILEHHDHDVWSDTFADPAFYGWVLDATTREP